jgi:hypothetical protein
MDLQLCSSWHFEAWVQLCMGIHWCACVEQCCSGHLMRTVPLNATMISISLSQASWAAKAAAAM